MEILGKMGKYAIHVYMQNKDKHIYLVQHTLLKTKNHQMHGGVLQLCLCVWERESERERERKNECEKERDLLSIMFLGAKSERTTMIVLSYFLQYEAWKTKELMCFKKSWKVLKPLFIYFFLWLSGFPKTIKTREKLSEYLTVVIFTTSAQHAAVNFGQVGFLLYLGYELLKQGCQTHFIQQAE